MWLIGRTSFPKRVDLEVFTYGIDDHPGRRTPKVVGGIFKEPPENLAYRKRIVSRFCERRIIFTGGIGHR